MKFRILSDIHNEFIVESYGSDYDIEPLPDDKESVLILAGDVGLLSKQRTWLPFIESARKQFRYVFWIAGNHEFYHGNITKHRISDCIIENKLENVYTNKLILKREKIAVLGTTLWTDFDKGNPISMMDIQQGLNDYRLIKVGSEYSRLKPEYILTSHYKEKKQLFSDVNYYSDLGYKIIVVTHHHPSRQGIVEGYRDNALNGAYVSDLDREVSDLNIEYWICGHCHTAMSYSIGNTEVICNPCGYYFDNTADFNPTKTIEL